MYIINYILPRVHYYIITYIAVGNPRPSIIDNIEYIYII